MTNLKKIDTNTSSGIHKTIYYSGSFLSLFGKRN